MIWRVLASVRRLVLPAAVAAIVSLFLWRVGQGAPLAPPHGPGEMASSFTLPDLGGRAIALDSFRGRVVLLNFWATWCGPCRAELPALEELSRAHAGCLAVVGVALDRGPARQVADFALERGVTYPLLIDDGSAARAYHVVTIPHTVLIGPGGQILGTFHGAVTAQGIESALRETRPAALSC